MIFCKIMDIYHHLAKKHLLISQKTTGSLRLTLYWFPPKIHKLRLALLLLTGFMSPRRSSWAIFPSTSPQTIVKVTTSRLINGWCMCVVQKTTLTSQMLSSLSLSFCIRVTFQTILSIFCNLLSNSLEEVGASFQSECNFTLSIQGTRSLTLSTT